MSSQRSAPPLKRTSPVERYLAKFGHAKGWIAINRPEKSEEEKESLAHLVALDVITIPTLQMYPAKA